MRCRTGRLTISAVLALTLVSQMVFGVGPARAAEGDEGSIGRTPPRLSYAKSPRWRLSTGVAGAGPSFLSPACFSSSELAPAMTACFLAHQSSDNF